MTVSNRGWCGKFIRIWSKIEFLSNCSQNLFYVQPPVAGGVLITTARNIICSGFFRSVENNNFNIIIIIHNLYICSG